MKFFRIILKSYFIILIINFESFMEGTLQD